MTSNHNEAAPARVPRDPVSENEAARRRLLKKLREPVAQDLQATTTTHSEHLNQTDSTTVLHNLATPAVGVLPLPVNSARSFIHRPGISQEMLARAGIKNVSKSEAMGLVGFAAEGLAIPYRSFEGIQVTGKHGQPYYRLRLANPTDSAKYLSAKDSGCELYIPPGTRDLVHEGCTLGLVEGEFKALALTEAGFPCVGIGGIESFALRKSEDGDPELLEALQELILAKQPSRLAFIGDSDTSLIQRFAPAAIKLARLCQVEVVLPRIPLDAPGKGPDDLKQVWGGEFSKKWSEIMEAAEPVEPNAKSPILAIQLLRKEAEPLARLKQDAANQARERLVKLAAYYHSKDAVAYGEIEKIAEDSIGLTASNLRAAVTLHWENQIAKSSTTASPKGDFIILPGNERSITESAEDIFSRIAGTHTLFYRAGRVQEIEALRDGTRVFSILTSVQFRSRLEAYGKLVAWRSGQDNERVLKPTTCPEETADALLASLPARERLPNIITLSACPVLASKNGKPVIAGPGWHDVGGGLFVSGGETPPEVPLPEAVCELKECLADFDFTTEGDHSRAIAALIAPALKFGSWLSNTLPVDVAEADASQSGKTYRQNVVAAIYRETPNVVVQRIGGVGGLDESLSQKLIDGRPFILLDNLRGKLDSPQFESILTARGLMPARVPHRGEVKVDPSGLVFQITSNSLEVTRDLANRASIIRIKKRPENYQFRKYGHNDLLGHIMANQPRYLGCVFAVIQEWVRQGRPRTTETRHNFREWVQTLDWIVQNIFAEVPLMEQHDEARQRVTDPGRTWLRAMCVALRDEMKSGDMAAIQLAEFAFEQDILPPNLRDTNSGDMAASRAIGKIMSAIFGATFEVKIDNFTVKRKTSYSPKAGKDKMVYKFSW